MTSKMNSDMHIDVLFEILIEERKKNIFYIKYSRFSGASPKAWPRGLTRHSENPFNYLKNVFFIVGN